MPWLASLSASENEEYRVHPKQWEKTTSGNLAGDDAGASALLGDGSCLTQLVGVSSSRAGVLAPFSRAPG